MIYFLLVITPIVFIASIVASFSAFYGMFKHDKKHNPRTKLSDEAILYAIKKGIYKDLL